MRFLSFFDEFPELVKSEFRNIVVLNDGTHQYISPGNYAFLELFCPDINCDCRKVIINVISVNPTKTWAILNYGWESEDYYKKWWGKNPLLYQPMTGVKFDPPTNNPLKKEFLDVFQRIILHDKNYAKRIESHYFIFKEKMREKQKEQTNFVKTQNNVLTLSTEKIKRNGLCACNSGKKFKKCCLLTAYNT
jgi:hypothetical protein